MHKEITEYRTALFKVLDVDEVNIKDLRALHDKYNLAHTHNADDLTVIGGAMKARISLGIRVKESHEWLFKHGFNPDMGIYDADRI